MQKKRFIKIIVIIIIIILIIIGFIEGFRYIYFDGSYKSQLKKELKQNGLTSELANKISEEMIHSSSSCYKNNTYTDDCMTQIKNQIKTTYNLNDTQFRSITKYWEYTHRI